MAELFVGFIRSMSEGVLGARADRYLGLFGTFFLFILVCNLMGLVPGFSPPTSNFQTTLALGFASFVAFNYIGISDQGLFKYLAHFAGPIWWLAVLMFPLELVGTFVRPFSLGLRLFGNMTGDHLVLEIFTNLTKLGIPIMFYFFGTLVSVIQAFVFTLLTVIYVSLSVGARRASRTIEPNAELRRSPAWERKKRRGGRPGEAEQPGGELNQMKKVGKFLTVVVGAILATGGGSTLALAQEHAAGAAAAQRGSSRWVPRSRSGCRRSVLRSGKVAPLASAMESIGRNPSCADRIQTPMIIGLALMEALAIYGLIIAFILSGKF